MKIFLDANVLISVLNREYPLFSYSSRILSLADRKDLTVVTSPLCLAIAFYFAAKRNKKTARQKIRLLAQHLTIAKIDASSVKRALENQAIHDFEDGLEYYAAIDAKCDCIITEDKSDFYFSASEVLNCREFLEKYLLS